MSDWKKMIGISSFSTCTVMDLFFLEMMLDFLMDLDPAALAEWFASNPDSVITEDLILD